MATTSEKNLEALADEELVDAVRRGSRDAYGVLWTRHAGAGRAAARRVTSSFDPDDLVQESFVRILHAIQGGHGPTGPFRPYLYQTVRSVAISWSRAPHPIVVEEVPEAADPVDMADGVIEGSVTVTAFKALPERWQAVLWYTEVEGMDPREVAPLLGLSAGSVSALAYRAREGLRRSWLQAHVSTAGVPEECRWSVEQMGDYNRGALSARQKDRFEEHLTGCLSCSILVEEVDQVASRLGLLLVPLVLGVPAVLGGGSFAVGGAASAAPAGAFTGPTAELVSSGPAGSGGPGPSGPGTLGAATSGAGATVGGFSGGLVLSLVGAGVAVAVAVGVLVVAQPGESAPPAVAEQLDVEGAAPEPVDEGAEESSAPRRPARPGSRTAKRPSRPSRARRRRGPAGRVGPVRPVLRGRAACSDGRAPASDPSWPSSPSRLLPPSRPSGRYDQTRWTRWTR